MKICIAGGGLAGLSLGYNLKGEVEFEVIEKEERVGGLLRSEEVEGYTFDTGGSHIIFSKDEGILRTLVNLVGNVVMHRRRTMIYYRGSYIKYPFENGMFMLDPPERYEILVDFIRNLGREKRKPENLRDFFVQMFGEKMVEKYLGPYNEKIWKRSLEDIAMAWEEDRLPKPPVEDVLKAAVGMETEGYLHQLRFFYPLNGGIESLARSIYGEIKENVRVSTPLKSVNIEDSKILVNGEPYDYLVSTIPLPVLGDILGGEVLDMTKNLDYNGVTVVGIGARGKVPDYHWVYVPREDIVFHRIAFLSNYSPNMAPEGRVNIIAEISHPPGEEPEDAVGDTLEGLEKMGIKVEEEVSISWENRFAYVITDRRYFSLMPRIRKKLREMRIIPLGRHGNWEYLNMDAVWSRSLQTAEEIRGLR